MVEGGASQSRAEQGVLPCSAFLCTAIYIEPTRVAPGGSTLGLSSSSSLAIPFGPKVGARLVHSGQNILPSV